ncbi:MAG: hypothetical protein ACI4GB_08720, partial [Acutalibacteraceae bacterium]
TINTAKSPAFAGLFRQAGALSTQRRQVRPLYKKQVPVSPGNPRRGFPTVFGKMPCILPKTSLPALDGVLFSFPSVQF